MDNLREKLIELIDGYEYPSSNPGLADHLIANGVTVQRWIPVTERLPEERDSIFAKYYGTEKWSPAMFLTVSNDVLVTAIGKCGEKMVKVMHTTDGKWQYPYSAVKVTHWMPLPEPPKEVE